MPQLLVLILVGVGLWAGYKWFQRETRRVKADLRKAEEALRQKAENEIPSLEPDERGVYRPKDD